MTDLLLALVFSLVGRATMHAHVSAPPRDPPQAKMQFTNNTKQNSERQKR